MKDIKVGQWVRTKDNKFVKVYNNECYHCKKGIEYIVNSKDGITSVGCIPYEDITEIWTKTSDTTYTRQWVKE